MAVSSREISTANVSVRIVNWQNLLRVDWMLPAFAVMLAIVGFATMYSATSDSVVNYFQLHVVAFAVGCVIAVLIAATDYRFLVALAPVMYVVSLLMLVGVEFSGAVRGSERWLDLGIVRIQPSEMTKLIMVYSLAWYITKVGRRIRNIFFFGLAFVITGVPLLLILKQPDLGTAACLAPLVGVMLLVGGCRLWHLGLVILCGLMVIPFAWLQVKDFDPDPKKKAEIVANAEWWDLEYHQKTRIYTFLYPESDPKGGAWQTIQSRIAVGSGGMAGKGYMRSTQTRLDYLPEHHTDFIFSQFAEERGFIGVAVVIGLFAAFLLRGLIFARDCPDMAGTLLATGIVTVLAFHVFVNIAITVGMLPVTGLPLPFLSYGRSFYLTVMACVGVLLGVRLRRRSFVNAEDA